MAESTGFCGSFHQRADLSPSGSAVTALGMLPALVRYYDEYEEVMRSVESAADIWAIRANGSTGNLHFGELRDEHRVILKHFAMARFHMNALTGRRRVQALLNNRRLVEEFIDIACQSPQKAIEAFRTDLKSTPVVNDFISLFEAIKGLLYFFCDRTLLEWSASYANILKTIGCGYSPEDLRRVRDGSAIISFEEERKIIGYFDDLNDSVLRARGTDITDFELRNACILFWNYAHAMRPIQIANRNVSHVRVRRSADANPVVHVTFRYAKQRSSCKAMEQTRKMKRDWTPMMDAWLQRRDRLDSRRHLDRPKSLFGASPGNVTSIIADLTEKITGIRRVPYDLRHSAAQRKADAGCSRLELAEFLMHQDIDTAEAYIEMSPTQAEKINQALGLSPLFRAIDDALKRRSVDVGELHRLAPDQQIGAAPHGHLIAGIGGCAIGQSFCTKTPALACYECPKFMYLRDIEVHRGARQAVQHIMQEFIAAERTDRTSPAFLQLRRVVETIDAIVQDLESTKPPEAKKK